MQPPIACPSPQQASARRTGCPLTAPKHVGHHDLEQPTPPPDPGGRPATQDQPDEAATTGRPSRDCQHRGVRHQHGTRAAYVSDRCRCPACTNANRLEAKRRRTALAYGTWTGLVDAAPSRAHITHLRAAGLSLQGIAAHSGIGYGTVARIIYGDPSRKQPPTGRVRSGTQQRLLEVQIRAGTLTGRSRTDSTPTRRKLQALAALGWPLPTLAARLGRTPGNLRRSLKTATVTVTNALAIATLYDTLHDTLPPTRTPTETATAATTRTNARLAGWLPPHAWNDIDNDPDDQDPLEEPNHDNAWLDEIAIEHAINGDTVPLTRQERDEAIARLTRRGVSAQQIAELLRTSSRTVVRRRRSHRTAA